MFILVYVCTFFLQKHRLHFGVCVLSIRQLQFTAVVNTHVSGLFFVKRSFRYTFGPTAALDTFSQFESSNIQSTLQVELKRLLNKSACWVTA